MTILNHSICDVPTNAGEEMLALATDLFPICRSITGNGVRQTLHILKQQVPIEINEVATGTKVFDWTVPKEWNVNDAYVKNSKGERVIDFKRSNLHLLNFSMPVKQKVSLKQLKEHLFTLPEAPDWIPYRTSYYNENWGFCLSHNQYKTLADDTYEVYIDTALSNGSLTYGELFIQGNRTDEVLISTHICHPSLANDNLSGIVLSVILARELSRLPLKNSYRFLFVPGTIGSITWLCQNEANVDKIKHGLVAACLGDTGRFSYKTSRQQKADIDRIVPYVLSANKKEFKTIDFFPYGYDERQYCSPGFDLPIGCLMRTPHGEFPEYHTSGDNLSFLSADALSESLSIFLNIVYVIENNSKYLNLQPKGEPRLGKRGLYKVIGGRDDNETFQLAILWVLNLSDGCHTLFDIADRANMPFKMLVEAADALEKCGLLKEISNGFGK